MVLKMICDSHRLLISTKFVPIAAATVAPWALETGPLLVVVANLLPRRVRRELPPCPRRIMTNVPVARPTRERRHLHFRLAGRTPSTEESGVGGEVAVTLQPRTTTPEPSNQIPAAALCSTRSSSTTWEEEPILSDQTSRGAPYSIQAGGSARLLPGRRVSGPGGARACRRAGWHVR
jgi:hypothetical protein